MTGSYEAEEESLEGTKTWVALLFGVTWVIIGSMTILHVRTYPQLPSGQPGPALFPTIIGALLALFGTVLVCQAWVARNKDEAPPLAGRQTPAKFRTAGKTAGGGADVLVLLGCVIAYITLAELVGFIPIVAAIMFLLVYRSGQSLTSSVVVAVVVALAVYLLFGTLLSVPLPEGSLGVG